jgi:hypothetical protein
MSSHWRIIVLDDDDDDDEEFSQLEQGDYVQTLAFG